MIFPGRDDVDLERGRDIVVVVVGGQEELMGAKLAAGVLCMLGGTASKYTYCEYSESSDIRTTKNTQPMNEHLY